MIHAIQINTTLGWRDKFGPKGFEGKESTDRHAVVMTAELDDVALTDLEAWLAQHVTPATVRR